jgi:hypothetical protein
MRGLPGRSSDNAKPAAAYRDFDICVRSLINDGLRPWIDRAGFGITTMIKIDGGDFGVGQHESDAMT